MRDRARGTGYGLIWMGACVAPLFLAACLGNEGEPVSATESALHVRDIDSIGRYTGTFLKTLTDAPITSSACFLEGVGGPLINSDTSLEQIFVSNTSDGRYWVAGMSTSDPNYQQKIAYYSCVTGITRSQYETYNWSQDARDPSPTDMGPADGRVCFLNSISGWFYGNQESVRITISNGRWRLGGTYNTLHAYHLGAGATCFVNPMVLVGDKEYSIKSSPGTFGVIVDTDVDALAGSSNKNACGLSSVGGAFNDSADFVEVTWGGGDPKWWLYAASDSTAIYGSARCLNRNAY